MAGGAGLVPITGKIGFRLGKGGLRLAAAPQKVFYLKCMLHCTYLGMVPITTDEIHIYIFLLMVSQEVSDPV